MKKFSFCNLQTDIHDPTHQTRKISIQPNPTQPHAMHNDLTHGQDWLKNGAY